jgi:hypothetical protein
MLLWHAVTLQCWHHWFKLVDSTLLRIPVQEFDGATHFAHDTADKASLSALDDDNNFWVHEKLPDMPTTVCSLMMCFPWVFYWTLEAWLISSMLSQLVRILNLHNSVLCLQHMVFSPAPFIWYIQIVKAAKSGSDLGTCATIEFYKKWSKEGLANPNLLIHLEALAYDPATDPSAPLFTPPQ